MNIQQTLRRYPLLLAVAAAALWAVLLVLQRFVFELQGTLHDDVHTYLTVGRGILNGLTPYVDLFESKPPGVFLVAALSLKLFQGPLLIKLLQAASVLIIPICTYLLAKPRLQNLEEPQRTLWLLTSVIAGSMLTVYAFAVSGEGLIESLGSAICLIAAVLYDRAPSSHSWRRVAVLSLLFLLAIGLKEPFLLVIVAVSLLLMQSRQHFIHYCIIPLLIAAAAGLIVLTLLGYLGPYFSAYLAHMFGYHINQLSEMNGSFLVRGFLVQKTFLNISYYSSALAAAITLIVLSNLIASTKRSIRSLLTVLVALYLLFLAIGTGGDFYAHHFIFAIPAFAVLFVLTINQHRIIGWLAAICFVASTIMHQHIDYQEKREWWAERKTILLTAANTIDDVMDRCEWDRYLHVVNKGAGPFGYTKHSPYGPIFIQFNRFVDGSEAYREGFRQALLTAPLIVLRDDEQTNLGDAAKVYVNNNFSFVPPSCAGEFTQPLPYRLVFRTALEAG